MSIEDPGKLFVHFGGCRRDYAQVDDARLQLRELHQGAEMSVPHNQHSILSSGCIEDAGIDAREPEVGCRSYVVAEADQKPGRDGVNVLFEEEPQSQATVTWRSSASMTSAA